ncbi:hypothetical protein E1267_33800 [Nonomuraea longispora]|uniref:MFS transporter n=1 Tax=Nonomuraea longispora TaxID=1848320 RepID=A0A4R4MX15_9ACTN|nr:hypothetical protein [Nonomuraea longispora]TDC00768.1 hypothetical protein E1267_33800 [Nonomuraea longispora]
MAGLLPAIAADLDVGIPAAGQLVTVFALTLAVAAPASSWLPIALLGLPAAVLALLATMVTFAQGRADGQAEISSGEHPMADHVPASARARP